jgi:hypothetical protein
MTVEFVRTFKHLGGIALMSPSRTRNKTRRTIVGAAIAVLLVAGPILLLSAAASASFTWTSTGGPVTTGTPTTCMTLDEAHNVLYAGAQTGEVYRYQGGVWTSTGGPSAQTNINDIVYDPVTETLVAALYQNSSFEVFTYKEGGSWTLTGGGPGNVNPSTVATDGARNKLYAGDYSGNMYEYDPQANSWSTFGKPLDSNRCMVMDTGRHVLYAAGSVGTSWPPTPAVAKYDGASWSAFGTMTFNQVSSLALDSNRNVLYAGLWTGQSGVANVYRKNIAAGTDWVAIGTLCGGPEIYSLATDDVNNILYALAYDGHVYKNCDASSGSTWLDIGTVSPNTNFNYCLQYVPGSATLFCGTGNPDGEVYEQGISALTGIAPASGGRGQTMDVELTAKNSSFTGSSQIVFSGDGVDVDSTAVLGPNKLKATITIEPGTYLGPRNVWVKTSGDKTNKLVDGFTVTESPALSTWYLAEGTNAWSFSTYLTIENPNNSNVNVRLTYMDTAPGNGSGIVGGREIALPPLSQTSVSSVADIGNVDFSTKVECLQGKSIAVDRTMFWTGQGAPSPEGHSSIGATSLSRTWYLPEGSSNWGFETWTLVQNPGGTTANVTITYMTEKSGKRSITRKVAAHSRATYSMASDIGGADASIKVTSDAGVIAERSVYRNDRREGSCSIGATRPDANYFLSEGSTAWGFTTYVLVQNPNDSSASVKLTYMTPSGPVEQPPFTMAANSRKTIRVNDVPAVSNTDLSTMVDSDKPIVAERAMYWGAGTALGEAMHASVGLNSAHLTFMLPDGGTGVGRDTYTLVQNPNPGAVNVRVTYLREGGGTPVSFTDEIPPDSRRTYSMADKGINGRAAILVESLDGGRPIMAERSIYWNNRGAGTDTIGGYSD